MKSFLLWAMLGGIPLTCAETPDPPPVVTRSEFSNLEQRVAVLEQLLLANAAKSASSATTYEVVPTITAPVVPVATVVPAGHHAHVTVDGRTIVHGNWNHGSPSAHAGIARPWRKTATAGQVVQTSAPVAATESVQTFDAAPVWTTNSCPPGGCPSSANFERRGLFGRRRW